jgi:hypothetical protein
LILPWVELLAGLCLVGGFWRQSALYIINSMLIVSIVAIAQGLLRGLSFDCGCFSTAAGSAPVSWGKVVEDLIMLGAGISLVFFPPKRNREKVGKSSL